MLEPFPVFPTSVFTARYGFDLRLYWHEELLEGLLVWLLTRTAEEQERAQPLELFLENGHLHELRDASRGSPMRLRSLRQIVRQRNGLAPETASVWRQ